MMETHRVTEGAGKIDSCSYVFVILCGRTAERYSIYAGYGMQFEIRIQKSGINQSFSGSPCTADLQEDGRNEDKKE